MKKYWFKHVDDVTELLLRQNARTSSRRSFLSHFGLSLLGIGALTLLPVYRGGASETVDEKGDPNSCDYWRNCAIDGFLCGCCGGTNTSCPPGTTPSDITWIGTCLNPTDKKNYIISYNDCCGKSTCGSCGCQRDLNNTPIYRPQTSNHLNWCSGSQAGVPYHCSLSVVLGVKD